jgi:MSHA pilin protein MshA
MSKQKGFTLIELVIVIAVLGILAAIAVPKFIDLQSDAEEAAKKGMTGAVKSAHAVAIADLKAFPTVTQLADYVNGEDVAAEGADKGINVVVNAKTFTVPTYRDSKCTTATAADTGSNEDVVQCVGSTLVEVVP